MGPRWNQQSISKLSRLGFVLALCFFLTRSQLPAAAPTPPPGWRMELVAQSPLIRHPSVVCTAPDGRVFVAEDPMDISAPANATQGRIICFHPDGRRTVFAEKLYAVFGMQYLEGKLYVLHNPKFTVFTDDDGVGRDPVTLIEQTHPKPWALDWNDHVPANFQLAMDGYFYIAVGDKGIYGAVGRDGKRVDLPGGGILRMRPDGTALEVYCTGVRNILDVALNAEDELFTYDNTDEHDWMGRLTHMVDAGFYGYPHDFIPRRPYTLWMMYDFGAGAATGALSYNEDALPPEYRGNLFLADFGKRQVTRVVVEREGATFRMNRHEELFKNLPGDFRPVGITVSADGASLYICDWQHRDTKENVETGRLWKLSWAGQNHSAPKPAWYLSAALGRPFEAAASQLIEGLSHPSRTVRLTAQRRLSERRALQPLIALLHRTNVSSVARAHAIWALDAIDGGDSARKELAVVMTNAEVTVRRHAIRQSGQRQTRSNVGLLHTALTDSDATVRFQAATALGRIADSNSVPALLSALAEKDSFTRFATFTALNRIGRADPSAWRSITRGLENENDQVSEGVTFAMRDTYDSALVDVLASLASRRRVRPYPDSHGELEARLRALRLLAAIHHRTPEWQGEWGAYHPALSPPAKKTVRWTGTPQILALLRETLHDSEPRLRFAATEGLRSAADTNAAGQLRARFEQEPSPEVQRAIITTLGEFQDTAFADSLARVLRGGTNETETCVAAVRAAARIGGSTLKSALLDLFDTPGLEPSLHAEVAQALGELKESNALARLQPFLTDASRPLRLAAQRAIARMGGDGALRMLRPLLTNDSPAIRAEALTAVGSLRDRNAVPDLLAAWRSPETRPEALEALTKVSDARALDAYLDGLNSANPTTREQCRKALTPIRDVVLSELESRALALPAGVITELRRVYDRHARAKTGPIFTVATRALEPGDYERHAMQQSGDAVRGQRVFFDESGVACIKCHVVAGHGGSVGPDLTLIGAQFPRASLIEHLLQPSKAVREGYQQVMIETRGGEEFSGILKSETPETVTLMDANNRLVPIAKAEIATRAASKLSLMPEGLHVGLTLEQFADLIAYMESRKIDPAKLQAAVVPDGFASLFNGRNLDGWRELPPGTKRVDGERLKLGRPPEHWRATNSILEHDGLTGDLWSEREFGDFDLHLEWRWPDAPKWEEFPLINSAGLEGDEKGHAATLRVLDAGDSGVLLRGLYKAQANLFCYPVGSGEVWEYRTDPSMTPEQRRAVTPRRAADKPIGDWNEMLIQLRGDRMSVQLNGAEVIKDAQLPGLPARGPIGLQHEHGRIQFRNLWVREVK